MLKDITLGQYFPGNSLLHRADPRTKILLVMAVIVALFVCSTWIPFVILTVFIVGMVYASKLRLRMVMRGLKPLIFILVFTAVLNLFMTSGDTVLWRAGPLSITSAGVNKSILIVVRLVLLVISASLLTYTTSPIQLTDGLERLLSPLKKLHAPVHELAMMMSLALRFIPTLVEETDRIMCAQRARGADFDNGGLLRRAKALIPILVPLFVSAFRRADELATAMECRLYRGDTGRTRLRQLKFGGADAACAALTICFLGAAIALQLIMA
ncbi:MAG: energy-coupling factor transporter transmembrane protein EcfT [Eubacteriales bacterium]|nr:energy-coupling factor transporter transmembrane protein EcfT [Eubacteriales bacterium]